MARQRQRLRRNIFNKHTFTLFYKEYVKGSFIYRCIRCGQRYPPVPGDSIYNRYGEVSNFARWELEECHPPSLVVPAPPPVGNGKEVSNW